MEGPDSNTIQLIFTAIFSHVVAKIQSPNAQFAGLRYLSLGRTTLELFFQNPRQSHHAVYLTNPDHDPALVERKLKPCQWH